MADRTTIEWSDATWNPIRARVRATGKVGWHCEHASEGCRFCYAEIFNLRMLPNGGTGLPYKPGHRDDLDIFVDEKMLLVPLRWRRPRMIFVGSMTDLFADFVTDAMLDQVFAVMTAAWQHRFQLLTKRPDRMRAYLCDPALPLRIARAWCVVGRHGNKGWTTRAWKADGIDSIPRHWPLRNVWLGVSTEDQATADARVPELLATPAAVHFVSAEPLLGPLSLRWLSGINYRGRQSRGEAINEYDGLRALDWIIVGGESGPKARPMHPDWARSIRDQCAAAGVAFLFKQWGEWIPAVEGDDGLYVDDGGPAERLSGVRRALTDHGFKGSSFDAMWRVGKKAAGRLLDGVEHNGFPEVHAHA